MTRSEIITKGTKIINTLSYNECIAVLNKCHDLPAEFITALSERAKAQNGGKTTLELTIAVMQTVIN